MKYGYLSNIIFVLLISTAANAANYSLEIIQPQEGLSTTNRFYKAYPGIEYNVQVAAIGGMWPMTFELLTAPAGMSIDANTGEISWPSPTQSGSPHSVSVRVTDNESSTDTHSWTITVTTNGFYFLDAVNGKTVAEGGTGTFLNPWKTIADMYEGDDYDSKTANSYAYGFLYFRSGTYPLDGYFEDGPRMAMVSNYKPNVWLAYPGDTQPVITAADGFLIFYSGCSNIFFDGLKINVTNSRVKGIQIDSGSNNVVMRNCLFDMNDLTGWTGGNCSLIMISHSGIGQYWVFSENTFENVLGDGYGILGYTAEKVLVADNTFTNISGHPVGPKEGTNLWFIRGNTFYNNSGYYGINVQYSNSHGINSGNIEISFNNINAAGNRGIYINSNRTAVGGPVFIYRNTVRGYITLRYAQDSNGPFSVYNNVIVDDNAVYVDEYETVDEGRIIVSNNLTGTTSDSIIDANGELTEAYDEYIGSMGHMLSGDSPGIGPVMNFNILGTGSVSIGGGTGSLTIQ